MLGLTVACFTDVLSGHSFTMVRECLQSQRYTAIRRRTWYRDVPWQVFPALWAVVYCLIVAAAFTALTRAPIPFDSGVATIAWALFFNIVINKCVPSVFFVLRMTRLSLVLLLLLSALNILVQYELWHEDLKLSFGLYFPYTVWGLVVIGLNVEWCLREKEFDATTLAPTTTTTQELHEWCE